MGVRFYLRLQEMSDDWIDNGSGNALAREYEHLERMIRKQGHRRLMEFYVPAPEEMVGNDKEEWYNPMEGLSIMDAMAKAADERKHDFKAYEKLKEDLRSFRFVLDRAASLGKRWNLGMYS